MPDEKPPSSKKTKASTATVAVSEHAAANYPPSSTGRIVDGERQPHAERWKHAAAAALHNWGECAHHEAEEMKLSASDYAKAIEAACKLNDKGVPTPHDAAFYAVPTVKA